MTVDWINDKLYFSFGDGAPDHLAIYNITTGTYNNMALSTASVFYDLAVDPIDGYVMKHSLTVAMHHTLCCSVFFHPGTCIGQQEVNCVGPH